MYLPAFTVRISFILVLVASASFPQNILVDPATAPDYTEDIQATFLNFDEVPIIYDNSIPIAPNRYAGVSFYAARLPSSDVVNAIRLLQLS